MIAARLEGVLELHADVAGGVAAAVASAFVEDASKVWWWDSLHSQTLTINYGERDVFAELRKLIKQDERVRLFVTDDEPPPWPAFEGLREEIFFLIGEQSYFEFFLVPANAIEPAWVIFDTHHDQLIVAGQIANT
ncbi:MAG: hypothetical protein JWN73_3565 [Betaproteobacteria bacterium]|nr:hypothetical protein [Betaproteobacteria bacterium]